VVRIPDVLTTYRVHTYLRSTYLVRTWGKKYELKRSGTVTRWYDTIAMIVRHGTEYEPVRTEYVLHLTIPDAIGTSTRSIFCIFDIYVISDVYALQPGPLCRAGPA
jgi:hypothetical protein